MDQFRPDASVVDDPVMFHRFVEASKFAYAQRFKIGDTTDPGINVVKCLCGCADSMSRRGP
jgi:hypothetical protein